MSYTTQQELIDRFSAKRLIELTDDADEPTGEINATTVADAIEAADAVIDGYVGKRYQLPLTSVPTLLKPVAQNIVFYQLHVDVVTDKVKDDYAQAMKTLDAIARGIIQLGVAGVEIANTTTGEASVCAAPRTDLSGYCS